jgi:hypothetical protein
MKKKSPKTRLKIFEKKPLNFYGVFELPAVTRPEMP